MTGEASFARSGPFGVMIFCTRDVREKLRYCSWRARAEPRGAANCRSGEDSMLRVPATKLGEEEEAKTAMPFREKEREREIVQSMSA